MTGSPVLICPAYLIVYRIQMHESTSIHSCHLENEFNGTNRIFLVYCESGVSCDIESHKQYLTVFFRLIFLRNFALSGLGKINFVPLVRHLSRFYPGDNRNLKFNNSYHMT